MRTRTHRVRFLLPGTLMLAVLCGGCGASSSSSPASGTGTGTASADPAGSTPAGLAMAASPTVVTAPAHRATPSTHKSTTPPSPSASASSPAPRTSSPGTTPAARPTASAASSARTSASPTASSPAAQPTNSTAAAQVLALINQHRASAGLPALTITSGLETSSAAHNQRMADGCGLSHQCPGEAPLGDRETAAGVHWTDAGENIGEGGPVANTTAAITQMAVGLTQSMLDEKPPDDGHRMNILSSTFTHIGITVFRDSAGTVWLTQDFSN